MLPPPGFCGDAANSVCCDPRGTLRTNGTVSAVLSTVSCTPLRFDVNVRSTRFGVIEIVSVSCRPPLSCTVSDSS
jgi:hypothetical protein